MTHLLDHVELEGLAQVNDLLHLGVLHHHLAHHGEPDHGPEAVYGEVGQVEDGAGAQEAEHSLVAAPQQPGEGGVVL